MSIPKPVAIRSLQCQDHAVNLPPRVTTVLWFLGRRCNYDCSYCSPHVHDAVSPWIDLDAARNFVHQYREQQRSRGLTTKWLFTGGEPFLDPGFLPLLRELHRQSPAEQINVTTNGSLPGLVYQQAARMLQGITFSLHLERSQRELEDTVEKIAGVQGCRVSVNLMALPGHFTQVEWLLQDLQSREIPVVLRKITPIHSLTADLFPHDQAATGKKSRRLLPVKNQTERKMQWRERLDSSRRQDLKQFYSREEEEFIRNHDLSQIWKNCGVWYDNGDYAELNTDVLVAGDQNSFLGWSCFAGVDSIYIDWDGSIYRGMCMNGGAVGHISMAWTPVTEPTVCHRQWCNCVCDIAVRKSQQLGDTRTHG